jgi:hypothetical protein
VREYLEIDDLLAAAEAAVGGRANVRDDGLLQAAGNRSRVLKARSSSYAGGPKRGVRITVKDLRSRARPS